MLMSGRIINEGQFKVATRRSNRGAERNTEGHCRACNLIWIYRRAISYGVTVKLPFSRRPDRMFSPDRPFFLPRINA